MKVFLGDLMLYGVVNNLNTLVNLWGEINFDNGYPELVDLDYPLLPTNAGGNIPWGGAFEFFNSYDQLVRLELALADPASRNFYWWGHANGSSLGPTVDGPDKGGQELSAGA